MTTDPTDSTITRFYVCYHEPEPLAAAIVPPGATRVLLTDPALLPARLNDPRIAESRFLLAMALNPNKYLPASGYVGLFHASYDRKFPGIPTLAELPGLLPKGLTPDKVAAVITCAPYIDQADRWHSGIGTSLARVLSATGIQGPSDRPGPMANSFVAHVSVWRRFLPDWLRMYVAAADEIESQQWDQTHCKPGIAPAYLCERFTTAWFAAQHDLSCCTIVGKDRRYYTATNTLGDANPEDVVANTHVTVNHAKR